jgi:hypothetical protein
MFHIPSPRDHDLPDSKASHPQTNHFYTLWEPRILHSKPLWRCCFRNDLPDYTEPYPRIKQTIFIITLVETSKSRIWIQSSFSILHIYKNSMNEALFYLLYATLRKNCVGNLMEHACNSSKYFPNSLLCTNTKKRILKILSRAWVAIDEFGLVTGFIESLQIVNRSNYSAIANSHTQQFTTPRTKSSQPAVSSQVVAW